MLDATAWPLFCAIQSINLVAYLITKNLALQQQLLVLQRHQKRPRPIMWDR